VQEAVFQRVVPVERLRPVLKRGVIVDGMRWILNKREGCTKTRRGERARSFRNDDRIVKISLIRVAAL
jgi:hypothetical protein